MPVFPMHHVVEVFAPATIANLGPGFDILGMAINEPYDVIRAERLETPGVVIHAIMGDGGRLPLEPENNTAGISPHPVLLQLRIPKAAGSLPLHKALPLENCRGLIAP